MANDRIYLRCPVCSGQQLLYKYYPAGGYTWDPTAPDILGDKIGREDFMDVHLHRCGERFEGDLDGNPFFVLVTESQARIKVPL